MKFTVGDRVVLSKDVGVAVWPARKNVIGTVQALHPYSACPYDVLFDGDDSKNYFLFTEEEIELSSVANERAWKEAVSNLAAIKAIEKATALPEAKPPVAAASSALAMQNYSVQNSAASLDLVSSAEEGIMRKFGTGATRNVDHNRIDPEAFIDPAVLLKYSEYMNRNRVQADGSIREGDNWQKGIPYDAYAKSLNRHHLDFWLRHRGHETHDDQVDNLCAIIFNSMGYLSELLKEEKALHPREV